MLRGFLISIYAFWCINAQAQEKSDSILDLEYVIEFDNVTLSAALRQLNRQTQINFSYNTMIIPKMDKFSVMYDSVSLRSILEDILSKANLYFKEVNGTVVILKQPTSLHRF